MDLGDACDPKDIEENVFDILSKKRMELHLANPASTLGTHSL